jgi:hypothetical protein
MCHAGSSPILLQSGSAVNSPRSAQSRVAGHACREAQDLENNQGVTGDLRTTEIAASHVDLGTKRTLSAEGLMNRQSAYGGDIIASWDYVNIGSTEAGCSPALRCSRGWVFQSRFPSSS